MCDNVKSDCNTSKREFIENIKKWVMLDNQTKLINDKMKYIRESKQRLNAEICTYMTSSMLLDSKIGISNGEIGVYDKKEYSSLTYDYIERKLSEIILDAEQVSYIIQYLKDNREITIVQEVRRKNHNKS
jgi:hypothetical protein